VTRRLESGRWGSTSSDDADRDGNGRRHVDTGLVDQSGFVPTVAVAAPAVLLAVVSFGRRE
jgi:hypothetical protein